MKKEYQLIALDIDGTLLDSKKQVAPETLEAIRRAARAGKTVVYDTGRATVELDELIALIPEIRWAIFSSGAGLYDIQENAWHRLRPIPAEQVRAVAALAATKDLMPQIVVKDQDIIQQSHLEHLEYYNMGIYRPLYERTMTTVPDIFEVFRTREKEILKINLYHADARERIRTREQLAPLGMETIYSEISSVECSAAGVDKGSGLEALCRHLGIPREASVAVGDAENDLPMIRAAGLGVAMGNAIDAVRAAADVVVADADHGGCAEAISLML